MRACRFFLFPRDDETSARRGSTLSFVLSVFCCSQSMRRRNLDNNMSTTNPDYTEVSQDPESADFPSSFPAGKTRKAAGKPLCPRSYNCRRRLSMMGVLALFVVAGLLASLELGRRRGHLPKGKERKGEKGEIVTTTTACLLNGDFSGIFGRISSLFDAAPCQQAF
jgi:hypothetical protein